VTEQHFDIFNAVQYSQYTENNSLSWTRQSRQLPWIIIIASLDVG